MADEIDAMIEREQTLLDAQIKQRKPEGPEATGECLYCAEPLPAPRRWCDAECCRTWETDQRLSPPPRR